MFPVSLQRKKVVYLEELASEFNMRTQVWVDKRLQSLGTIFSGSLVSFFHRMPFLVCSPYKSLAR